MSGFSTMGYGVKSLANPSTAVTLKSGGSAILPSGQYMVMPGLYTALQYWDSVSVCWRNFSASPHAIPQPLLSDGYNFRLFNPTGTVVGGIVTNGGTANTAKNGFWPAGSSSVTGVTAVVAAAGGETGSSAATFNCIVGGALGATNGTGVTIVTGGSGYLLPPVVTFDAPPVGGLRATGFATLTAGGAVTSITITNQGAGYASIPNVTITPVSGDTTGAGATATVALDTVNPGKLTAVTVANAGAGYTAVPSAVVPAGLAGSPSITPVMCLAIVTSPTVSSGTQLGNGHQLIYPAQLSAATNVTTNPAYTTGLFSTRSGVGAYNTSASGGSQVILDGGLSQLDVSNLPVITLSPNGTTPGAATYASGASGGITDTSFVIPI